MVTTDNPFRAGMALPPPIIAGRDRYLDEVTTLMINAQQNAAITRVFVGPRGVGKTVLLNAWRDRARDRGWITARLAADKDPQRSVLATLVANYDDLVAQLGRRGPRKSAGLTASLDVNLGPLNASVTRPGRTIDPATIDQTIGRLGEAARRARVGVYLAFDDLHAATTDELSVIAKSFQTVTTEHLPVVFAGAGLRELRDRAPEETSITFTERVTWTDIGALEPSDTDRALLEPFRRSDWKIAGDSGRQLVELSEGYPYLVQLLGTCAWDLGAATRRLDLDVVRATRERALDQLDEGMYRIRWNRCSPAETHYLSAMARLVQQTGTDEATGRRIADLLGREPKELSTIRQRLIDKQLIETTGAARGSIRFTLPFYDRYILERAEQAGRNQASRWTTRADRGTDL